MSGLNTVVHLCKEVFDERSEPTQIGNVCDIQTCCSNLVKSNLSVFHTKLIIS